MLVNIINYFVHFIVWIVFIYFYRLLSLNCLLLLFVIIVIIIIVVIIIVIIIIVYYSLPAAFETNNLGQISSNQPCLDGLKFSINVVSPAGQYKIITCWGQPFCPLCTVFIMGDI